ncbi:MAG TPA: TIM barrel protein [Roseiflexaceae bacterium]|nr:TIM barrel protein [Roseiflexaceae bacterium]HMP39097.1 TIM barrel protein [Roseiflexaceae bacterium]
MRRLALTSWSMHRYLGAPTIGRGPGVATTPAVFSLAELPGRMRHAGIGTLEICHFHLTSTDAAYLAQVRGAIGAAGIELFSLLIDTGDISAADPATQAAEEQLVAGWIDVAAQLGAGHVRVIAGDSAADDAAAVARSATALGRLAGYAQQRGVRVLTENFKSLASTSANCLQLLDTNGGAVGLCADIGNFPAAQRIDEFRRVASHAESVHVKASYTADGQLQAEDVRACLEASVAAGFGGPYTLVYDRPGDSWAGVAELQRFVGPYCAG